MVHPITLGDRMIERQRWWLNQPIWRIWSSKWESSPNLEVKIPKLFETTTQEIPKSPTGFFATSLLYLFGGPRSFKIRHQAIPQLKKLIHAYGRCKYSAPCNKSYMKNIEVIPDKWLHKLKVHSVTWTPWNNSELHKKAGWKTTVFQLNL